MPKSLKDLFLDRDYNVPIIEKPTPLYKNDIIDSKVIESEVSKNGVLLQFAKQLPKIYGTDLVRIESRGSIDPARTIAVKSQRPVGNKGGGFGRMISNLLGQGGAYRPSDTIFTDKPNTAPVSQYGQPINGDWSGLKNAVEQDIDYLSIADAALDYKGPSGLSNAMNGLAKGNNPKEMAQEAVGRATKAAQNLVTKGLNKALTSKRKKKGQKEKTDINTFEDYRKKKHFDNNHKGSEYFKLDDKTLKKFDDANVSNWDDINNTLLEKATFTDKELQDLVSANSNTTFAYLGIKPKYYSDQNLIFPAAIESITEAGNPEWTDFRYVGSPFKVYRYVGVEREVKIDFKVYYFESPNGANVMKEKLNRLRKFIFPDENLATVDLANEKYAPLVFRPKIVVFSLAQYYKNIDAIVTSLDISIPKEVSWAHSNPYYEENKVNRIYPTCVDVSISFKIIENHKINNKTITLRLDDMSEENGKNTAKPNEPVEASTDSTFSMRGGNDPFNKTSYENPMGG